MTDNSGAAPAEEGYVRPVREGEKKGGGEGGGSSEGR